MPARADLPPEPFLDWAQTYTREFESVVEAEKRMGISSGAFVRALHRARHEVDALTLRSVDAYFTAAEQPHALAIRYPLDEPEHDRWCEECHEIVTTNDDLICPWCESETTP